MFRPAPSRFGTTTVIEQPAAAAEREQQRLPLLSDEFLDALLDQAEEREQSALDRLGLAYATSYETIPLADLPYLQGHVPVGDPSRWEWEPVTEKFVDKAARDYLTRDEFLGVYYPDVLAERTVCRRVPVDSVPLGPGLPTSSEPALAAKSDDVAAVAVYVLDREGYIARSDPLVVGRDATRADVVDALDARAPLPLEDVVDYRLVVLHPRLFDFASGRASPGAPEYDLAGDETLGDVVARFGGLGADDAQRLSFVVPVLAEPVRRQRPRLARVAARPVFLGGGTPEERLSALAEAVARRREDLQDLDRRAGRSLSEREEDERAALAARRPAVGRPRERPSPEAEAEIETALSALFASATGSVPLPPADEAAIIEWLASAVLSGRVTEGIDYGAAYDAVRRRLVREAFGPAGVAIGGGGESPGRRVLLVFLQQIDALVDDARDIERRSATSRDRVPVFDDATGDVVAFEERLPSGDEDPNDVAVSIIRGVPVLPPAGVATAEGVIDVARAQCRTCGKWRAVRSEAFGSRVDYVVRYDAVAAAPGTQEAPPSQHPTEAECVRFGFEFQHTLPTGLEPVEGRRDVESVPMDSQYVVVAGGAVPDDLRRAAPDAMRPIGASTVQGFGVVSRVREGGRDLYDVEFGLLPGASFLVPAASTTVYVLPSRDSVSRATGRVTVVATHGIDHDHEEEEEEEEGAAYGGGYGAPERLVVPGGRAVDYFCVLAGDAGVLRIPVTGLRDYEAQQWECGDPSMDPHSSPVRELLERLRREEAFERALGPTLPPAARAEVRERIARLREALHSDPEETAESIDERMRAVGIPEPDRRFDELARDLDEIARRRLDAVRGFVSAESEAATEAEDAAEQAAVEAFVAAEQGAAAAASAATAARTGRRRQREPAPVPETSIGQNAIKRARLDEQQAIADAADALVDEQIALRRNARALAARGLSTASLDERIREIGVALNAIDQTPPEVTSATAAAAGEAPTPRARTFYEYGTDVLASLPLGAYTRDVAAMAWDAAGGAPSETAGIGSQAFRTFVKRMNAALKRPRVGAPIIYIPYGPPDAPDRYGGLYVLRRFVTPDSVDAIADAAAADSARRGRPLPRDAFLDRLIAEATGGPSS